jgi:hypothetical protein
VEDLLDPGGVVDLPDPDGVVDHLALDPAAAVVEESRLIF